MAVLSPSTRPSPRTASSTSTTATSPNLHNRVSRFTASGDVAATGSEQIILELNPLSSATNHNGGALHFGSDGKLYVAVGDNASGSNSQTLGNLLGKILRINADGSIPPDNPFFGAASGQNRAIWALGLRNPFTFSFQPGTARMFINDVGQNTWEEVNDGVAGSNYGWPDTEGPTSDPRFRGPIFYYGHGGGSTTGCAITGGAFYNPPAAQFPAAYVGDYFFADYCSGWIRKLDPANGNTVVDFASGARALSTSRSRTTAASTTCRAGRAAASTGLPTRPARRRRSRRTRPARPPVSAVGSPSTSRRAAPRRTPTSGSGTA